jgi:hypothetical protein
VEGEPFEALMTDVAIFSCRFATEIAVSWVTEVKETMIPCVEEFA